MSDPAGAAHVLRQALGRPEASRLGPLQATRSRELLARSLLKIGRPQEARALLQTVIKSQPDREAYWLLSCAALQEKAIPETIAAIQAAGSYRANHPLELEPGPYVGGSTCVPCHTEKARAFQMSRHTRTLTRGKALLDLPYPDGSVVDPDDAAVTHSIRRERNRSHYQTRVKDDCSSGRRLCVWIARQICLAGRPRQK